MYYSCSTSHAFDRQLKWATYCAAVWCKVSLCVSPEGSLWCSVLCWNKGGIGSWVVAFCWASVSQETGKGLRNGPPVNSGHPQYCWEIHKVKSSCRNYCSSSVREKQRPHPNKSQLFFRWYALLTMSTICPKLISNAQHDFQKAKVVYSNSFKIIQNRNTQLSGVKTVRFLLWSSRFWLFLFDRWLFNFWFYSFHQFQLYTRVFSISPKHR